jgi:hypothetical protein
MNRPAGQVWLFRVTLPADLPNPPRYMAAVLKYVWRRFGVKATAVLDDAQGTHRIVKAASERDETSGGSP